MKKFNPETNEKFKKNYDAFKANFGIDLYFYKSRVTKEIYVYKKPLQADLSNEHEYIQVGSLEYITGWLYGAVQCNNCYFDNCYLYIVVINKKYNDKNGNRKYQFNIFNALTGSCLNDMLNTPFRNSKKGLSTYKYNFENFFTKDKYTIIDLTDIN